MGLNKAIFILRGKKKRCRLIWLNFSWTDSYGKKIALPLWGGQSGIPAGRGCGWLRKIAPNGRGVSPGMQRQQTLWAEGSGNVGGGGIEAGAHLQQQGPPTNCPMGMFNDVAAMFLLWEESARFFPSCHPSSTLQHTVTTSVAVTRDSTFHSGMTSLAYW